MVMRDETLGKVIFSLNDLKLDVEYSSVNRGTKIIRKNLTTVNIGCSSTLQILLH